MPVAETTDTAAVVKTTGPAPTASPDEEATATATGQEVMPTESVAPSASVTPMPSAMAEPPTSAPSQTATTAPTETATQVPTETATMVPTETATMVPTETATGVPTATATEAPAGPEVLYFEADPGEVANLGDVVQVRWEAVGESAELCTTNCFGPALCEDVPLIGQRTVVADQVSLHTNGFALRVMAGGETEVGAAQVRFLCRDLRGWFFEPAPSYCPAGEAWTSYAAGQGFERGFMVWVEDTDEFYVFASEPDGSGLRRFYRQVGLDLLPGASPDNRVGEDPPPGLVEPVSGFGLVWRNETEWSELGNVRDLLGWAKEPEFGFDLAYQEAILPCPRGWAAYMREPHGDVLRLGPATTVGWQLVWDYAGE